MAEFHPPSHSDSSPNLPSRPHTTVVLAMTADGKIADRERSPARFGSAYDKAHLEAQIALADGVLFGANTLRAYGTTLRVTNPNLLKSRHDQKKPPQPIHMVCSGSAALDPHLPFFRQPVPRWLITTAQGEIEWRDRPEFERIITVSEGDQPLDWNRVLSQFPRAGIEKLVVTGGGALVADLLAANLVDELWLTICPLILGGAAAPTPVQGPGFLSAQAPQLQLLSAQVVEQEVLLHYRLQESSGLN